MPADAPDDCPEDANETAEGVWYSYATIQAVPRVERGEYLNVGVILFARTVNYLEARIALNEARLKAFAPDADLDELRAHLANFQAICAGEASAGPIALLSQTERFHWLTSPRSTIIQTSAIHVGRCPDPAAALEDLLRELVS